MQSDLLQDLNIEIDTDVDTDIEIDIAWQSCCRYSCYCISFEATYCICTVSMIQCKSREKRDMPCHAMPHLLEVRSRVLSSEAELWVVLFEERESIAVA